MDRITEESICSLQAQVHVQGLALRALVATHPDPRRGPGRSAHNDTQHQPTHWRCIERGSHARSRNLDRLDRDIASTL